MADKTPEPKLSPATEAYLINLVAMSYAAGESYIDFIAANGRTNMEREHANRTMIMAGVLMIARATEWCPNPDDAQQAAIEEFPELLKSACRQVELPEWRAEVERTQAGASPGPVMSAASDVRLEKLPLLDRITRVEAFLQELEDDCSDEGSGGFFDALADMRVIWTQVSRLVPALKYGMHPDCKCSLCALHQTLLDKVEGRS